MYCRVPHFAAHSTGSSCAQNSIVSSASRVQSICADMVAQRTFQQLGGSKSAHSSLLNTLH